MKLLFKILICITFCAIGLLNCANTGGLTGAGSETTNSLTGKVGSVDGNQVGNAIVHLIPASYDPVKDRLLPDSMTVTTNGSGEYVFRSIDTGEYNIFVQSQSGSTRALVLGVHVIDTVIAPHAMLSEVGAVRVIAPEDANKVIGYAYVPGTPLFVFFNNGCKPAILDSIPSGTIPEIVYSSTNSLVTSVLRSNVTVKSADTVVAANSAWAYTRRLFLNTTVSGASIMNTVYDFPVLVRLDQSMVDFSEVKAGGADLRFTTSDNRLLSYEIERWDSTSREAEIWVRVDTVLGNNDRQCIVMYWGNKDAQNISSSAATFDTSRGFQGVWHLGGEGTEMAYDATPNGYHGTPYSMTTASSVKGAVGMTRSFNGSSNYITMQNTAASRLNFSEDGVYSMSLWVYADTIDSIFHAIAGKGHEQYYMQYKCLKNNKATWEFVEFQDQSGWEYTQDSVTVELGAKKWVYLTGVRSGASQRFYINGEKVVDTAALMTGTYSRNSSENFMIGSYGRSITIPYAQGWSFFRGKIDEVRVSSVAPSDDWIRLCYMNQKADDALVVFDK
jgi:hypothetical protein